MNDPDNAGDRLHSSATDDDAGLDARLDALGEKIAAKRAGSDEPRRRSWAVGDRQGQTLALRLATEFVAGILVGGAIGWFLDQWIGTSPWGLIVFLILGFIAGVLNALRSAGVVKESPADALRAAAKDKKTESGGE